MRALVISDTHFGAWTGEDLLHYDFALEALEPALADVDELIILGDLFDFLFSTVENSFNAAEGFFDLVERTMAGRRLVFLAGNHDHHIVVRQLRTYIELKIATGDEAALEAALAERPGFLQRFLDRRLPEVESVVVYPTYRFGDALCFHGHYLDAHMTGSIAERLLNRGTWGMAGGREAQLTVADYEATVVPLTELLFTVAQLPRGTTAQMAAHDHLERLGRLVALTRTPGRELRRIWSRVRRGAVPGGGGNVARAVSSSDHPSEALRAYAQVVRNLGWDRDASTFVFAHTHQPLAGAVDDGLRFWNSGSWIYEPPEDPSPEAWVLYRQRGWPGTAVLLDTEREEPELLRLLADYGAEGRGWLSGRN